MSADRITAVCRRERVNEEFLAMPDEMRRVFMLRNCDGLSVIETAQATGLSPAMVHQLYAAALVPMRVIYGQTIVGAIHA